MKTTIDLPDVLAARAKQIALEQGTTLRELVTSGLRHEVERHGAAPDPTSFRLRTTGGRGLQAGVDPERLRELAYDR